jgi:hypothetical protein
MPDNMNSRLNKILILWVISIIVLLVNGCTSSTENETPVITPNPMPSDNTITTETTTSIYKTYEMKADDVRLEYLEHPLFSIEYPDFFNLVDLNNIPGYPMSYDVSTVIFTYLHDDPDLLDSHLVIGVESPSVTGFNNASEKLEDLFSPKTPENGSLSIKEVSVFGIPAYYLESFKTDVVSPSPRKYNMSYRLIGFENVGLVWTISMSWNYFDSEPPEIEEYFNHVIDTFRILD